MKISYNWLSDYTDITFSAEELAEKMSLIGLEVEDVVLKGFEIDNVFIAKVLTCDQHPNAEKLKVCQVDYGKDSQVQVICGAPNVAVGQMVPFADIGTVFPNGLKIKKVNLRGVESNGMICSRAELNIDGDHSGIWILPENAPIGLPLTEYLKDQKDIIFDISVTPNRPDCLSHIGIAREISAFTGNPLNLPEINLKETNSEITDDVKISIHTPEGCPRYAARLIKNVTIGDSPKWLRDRLESVGIRSINNVVDVTNFILLEMGHPLHAFDFSQLAGNEINVRLSKNDEEFVTLDGEKRALPKNSVLICDKEKPVAIGGIMGGANSEVVDDTRSILLEAAYFDPGFINKTAKSLKLSTEASFRFERGVNPEGVIYALDRASQLIAEVSGGLVSHGIIDVYPNPVKLQKIAVNVELINKIVGIEFSFEEIKELLSRVGIKTKNNYFICPTYRADLTRVADIAEEVARVYGYDNIPLREETELPYGIEQNSFDDFIDELKILLSGMGLNEVITNSMGKKDVYENCTNQKTITIMNPVSGDFTSLRNSLVPSLLEVTKTNINRQNTSIKIFEINTVFIPAEQSEDWPVEEKHLSVLITGNRFPIHWDGKQEVVDFFDIKGIYEDLMDKISLDNYKLISYDNFVGTGENLAVVLNDEIIGFIARVDARLLKNFDIEQSVYLLNLNIDGLFKSRKWEKKYKPVARYPGTERDVAFVIKKNQIAEEIVSEITKLGGKELKSVKIFDRYLGKHLEQDEQSLAFKLYFQSFEKTLTDKEVNLTFKKIIQQITKKFNAKLRT